jgi:hypothetical protein
MSSPPGYSREYGYLYVDVGPDKGYRILVPDVEDGGGKSCEQDHVIGQYVIRDYEMRAQKECGGL